MRGVSGWGKSRQDVTETDVYKKLRCALQSMRDKAVKEHIPYIAYCVTSNQHLTEHKFGNAHAHCLIYAKNMELVKLLKAYWLDKWYATKEGIDIKECWGCGKLYYIHEQAGKHQIVQSYLPDKNTKQKAMKQLGIDRLNKYYVIVGFSNYIPPKGRNILVYDWLPKNEPLPSDYELVKVHGDAVYRNDTARVCFIEHF